MRILLAGNDKPESTAPVLTVATTLVQISTVALHWIFLLRIFRPWILLQRMFLHRTVLQIVNRRITLKTILWKNSSFYKKR